MFEVMDASSKSAVIKVIGIGGGGGGGGGKRPARSNSMNKR